MRSMSMHLAGDNRQDMSLTVALLVCTGSGWLCLLLMLMQEESRDKLMQNRPICFLPIA